MCFNRQKKTHRGGGLGGACFMKAILIDGSCIKISKNSPVVGKRFSGFVLETGDSTIPPKFLERLVKDHQSDFLKDHPVLLDVSHKFLHDHPLNKQLTKLQKCKHHLQQALSIHSPMRGSFEKLNSPRSGLSF